VFTPVWSSIAMSMLLLSVVGSSLGVTSVNDGPLVSTEGLVVLPSAPSLPASSSACVSVAVQFGQQESIRRRLSIG